MKPAMLSLVIAVLAWAAVIGAESIDTSPWIESTMCELKDHDDELWRIADMKQADASAYLTSRWYRDCRSCYREAQVSDIVVSGGGSEGNMNTDGVGPILKHLVGRVPKFGSQERSSAIHRALLVGQLDTSSAAAADEYVVWGGHVAVDRRGAPHSKLAKASSVHVMHTRGPLSRAALLASTSADTTTSLSVDQVKASIVKDVTSASTGAGVSPPAYGELQLLLPLLTAHTAVLDSVDVPTDETDGQSDLNRQQAAAQRKRREERGRDQDRHAVCLGPHVDDLQGGIEAAVAATSSPSSSQWGAFQPLVPGWSVPVDSTSVYTLPATPSTPQAAKSLLESMTHCDAVLCLSVTCLAFADTLGLPNRWLRDPSKFHSSSKPSSTWEFNDYYLGTGRRCNSFAGSMQQGVAELLQQLSGGQHARRTLHTTADEGALHLHSASPGVALPLPRGHLSRLLSGLFRSFPYAALCPVDLDRLYLTPVLPRTIPSPRLDLHERQGTEQGGPSPGSRSGGKHVLDLPDADADADTNADGGAKRDTVAMLRDVPLSVHEQRALLAAATQREQEQLAVSDPASRLPLLCSVFLRAEVGGAAVSNFLDSARAAELGGGHCSDWAVVAYGGTQAGLSSLRAQFDHLMEELEKEREARRVQGERSRRRRRPTLVYCDFADEAIVGRVEAEQLGHREATPDSSAGVEGHDAEDLPVGSGQRVLLAPWSKAERLNQPPRRRKKREQTQAVAAMLAASDKRAEEREIAAYKEISLKPVDAVAGQRGDAGGSPSSSVTGARITERIQRYERPSFGVNGETVTRPQELTKSLARTPPASVVAARADRQEQEPVADAGGVASDEREHDPPAVESLWHKKKLQRQRKAMRKKRSINNMQQPAQKPVWSAEEVAKVEQEHLARPGLRGSAEQHSVEGGEAEQVSQVTQVDRGAKVPPTDATGLQRHQYELFKEFQEFRKYQQQREGMQPGNSPARKKSGARNLLQHGEAEGGLAGSKGRGRSRGMGNGRKRPHSGKLAEAAAEFDARAAGGGGEGGGGDEVKRYQAKLRRVARREDKLHGVTVALYDANSRQKQLDSQMEEAQGMGGGLGHGKRGRGMGNGLRGRRVGATRRRSSGAGILRGDEGEDSPSVTSAARDPTKLDNHGEADVAMKKNIGGPVASNRVHKHHAHAQSLPALGAEEGDEGAASHTQGSGQAVENPAGFMRTGNLAGANEEAEVAEARAKIHAKALLSAAKAKGFVYTNTDNLPEAEGEKDANEVAESKVVDAVLAAEGERDEGADPNADDDDDDAEEAEEEEGEATSKAADEEAAHEEVIIKAEEGKQLLAEHSKSRRALLAVDAVAASPSAHIPKPTMFRYLLGVVQGYQRVWLLDEDISLVGFNVGQFLQHTSHSTSSRSKAGSSGISQSYLLVTQPLVGSQAQNRLSASSDYWKGVLDPSAR